MSVITSFAGSRWWRFDFHTHTPASEDYGKGARQEEFKRISPSDWLLDFMRASIDCVAVTDHNIGTWIDPLKHALNKLEEDQHPDYRPLTIFPGVEISVNGGVHILAILDPSAGTADIERLIGSVKFQGNHGSGEGVTLESLSEVVRIIAEHDGIAIPAHVDDVKGLFKEVEGPSLEQALDSENILAMEVVNSAFEPPAAYRSRKLGWARVLGSDSHHPVSAGTSKHPGSHYTWVKMESPTIEGLRTALLDGEIGWSTKRSDETSTDLNIHSGLRIHKITVREARYLGRNCEFEVPISPWLTTIIGGRGTGKSSLVEMLRLALGRRDELPRELLADFEKYETVSKSRKDSGLLKEDTELWVEYEKDGALFRVRWCAKDRSKFPVIEENVNGEWRPAEGEVARRFPVRIFSQKQVYNLAGNPSALLGVIDDASEVQYGKWAEEWNALQRRFFALRAKARELAVDPREEMTLRGELDDVIRRLRVFEEAGHANVLREYQWRRGQARQVDAWSQSWSNAASLIRQAAGKIVPESLILLRSHERPNEQDDVERFAERARLELGAVVQELLAAANRIEQVHSEWTEQRKNSSWEQAVIKANSDFQYLRDRLAEHGEDNPRSYSDLVQRRQQIEEKFGELNRRREEALQVAEEAQSVLQELGRLRRSLTQRRQEFLERVLSGNTLVRMSIVSYGAVENVEERLREILRRDNGFEKDFGAPYESGLLGELYVEGAAEGTQPRDGNGQSGDFEWRLEALKRKTRRIASGDELAGDKRFAAHLSKLPPDAFDHLDAWFPEDSVKVEFSPGVSGNRFQSIQHGSPGQKTSALLAFLMSYGDEPIVLDQPEDDLDNRLIYGLIVSQLRKAKSRRQVIVVTHNPNIVVNGDSELVVALTPKRGQTQIEACGGLQRREVREAICAVLEGGREAFDRRYHRIVMKAGRSKRS